ncbi:MAG: lasso peptide isopeptide bond-forming cyclase [Bacteroidota bacterium]
MSAVAGLYHLNGQGADQDALRRMVDAMPHCGPDGAEVWSRGPVGLGHRMLHTTPESLHEVLPLANAAGTLAVTADARIDNRAELLEQLHLGDSEESVTDSALILAAYETWGEQCLDHLVGDFAFAIWDEAAQHLFCARDHFGVRPFYYHHRAGRHFAFGTEIKALLAVPGVPQRLNEVRLADFLATMREDPENTIYQEVFRLPAAHALVVSPDALRVWRYYTLAPATDVPPDASDAEYEARFRELFTQAVRARLRSAFPVGSELSGGMDSSSITAVAGQIMADEGKPLHTVSLVYDDIEACDESPFINAVLEQEGDFVPHFVKGDRLGPLSNLDDVYTYLDDGLASGNQHLVWAAKAAAGDAGIRVLLDGLDGDNVVGHGLLYLKELAETGDWEAFARESKAAARQFQRTEQRHNFEDSFASLDTAFNRFGLARLQTLADESRWGAFFKELAAAERLFGVKRSDVLRLLWRRLVQPAALLRARDARRNDSNNAARPKPLLPLLDPDFAERIGMAERLQRFEDQKPNLTTVRDVQRQLLNGSRIQTALELTTHASAAHGIEIRHPFFDKRLVEFCLALPPGQSLKDGWTRSILRRALGGILPEKVQWRVGKAWLAPNFERGLYEQDRALLDEHVADLGPLRPYVDKSVVDGLYRRGKDVPNIEQAQLARITTLSFWLKKRFPTLTEGETLASSGGCDGDRGATVPQGP